MNEHEKNRGLDIIEEIRKEDRMKKLSKKEIDELVEKIYDKLEEIKILKELRNVLISTGTVSIGTAFVALNDAFSIDDPTLSNIALVILPTLVGASGLGYGVRTEIKEKATINELELICEEYPMYKEAVNKTLNEIEKSKIRKLRTK